MSKILFVVSLFASACTVSTTEPVENSSTSDEFVVPSEFEFDLEPSGATAACREACFGSWQCAKPCGFCTAPNTGGRGICITSVAIQPGDVVLD